MTTQDCEQVTSTISQSSSYVDEDKMKSVITSVLSKVFEELEGETNSPTEEFLSNVALAVGKFAGRLLGSGGRRMQTETGSLDE